jgi:excisionase family DNA binding protein
MKLLTVLEAAEILGVTAQGVHKMISVGTIVANKHSGLYLIERKEVTNALQRLGRGRPRKKWRSKFLFWGDFI